MIAFLLSGAAGWFAYRDKNWPRELPAKVFEGPAFANAGSISTLLSALPLVLSDEVRTEMVSASLLGTAALLFSLATFIALWLYSVVSAKSKGDKITLQSPLLIAVQGVVVMLMIVASGCFIAFIIATPTLGEYGVANHG